MKSYSNYLKMQNIYHNLNKWMTQSDFKYAPFHSGQSTWCAFESFTEAFLGFARNCRLGLSMTCLQNPPLAARLVETHMKQKEVKWTTRI